MSKQIVMINNKKFLIQNILKLSKTISLLGFWETPNGWSVHVHSVELSLEEWAKINV